MKSDFMLWKYNVVLTKFVLSFTLRPFLTYCTPCNRHVEIIFNILKEVIKGSIFSYLTAWLVSYCIP